VIHVIVPTGGQGVTDGGGDGGGEGGDDVGIHTDRGARREYNQRVGDVGGLGVTHSALCFRIVFVPPPFPFP